MVFTFSITSLGGERHGENSYQDTERETKLPWGLQTAQGTGLVRQMGTDTRARPRSSKLPPPSSLARSAGPWLTCDGAVVIVPWDPGQPHTPLSQVGELQVPGSFRPSWQQRKKTPRRTPELEPARPVLAPTLATPMDRSLEGGGHHSRAHPQPALEGQHRDHPLPSGGQGRTKRRLQFHLPFQEYPRMQGTERVRPASPFMQVSWSAMLFTRCVFTFKKASEEVWTLSHFLRIIIFYSVRHGSEGQELEGVWVLSEADRLRGWEGGRGPGQGGDGDVVKKFQGRM